SAHLTLTGQGKQLHVYCFGKHVLYVENSEFPIQWLQQNNEAALAVQLQSAPAAEQKLQLFKQVREKAQLKEAFAKAAADVLSTFFQGEVQECKLKQFPAVTSEGILTLSEVYFDLARPFVQSLSPDEMLPTREIPFKQSPN